MPSLHILYLYSLIQVRNNSSVQEQYSWKNPWEANAASQIPAALEPSALSWCTLYKWMATVSSTGGSCQLTDSLLDPIYFCQKWVITQRGRKREGLCWLSPWDQLKTCRASEDKENAAGYVIHELKPTQCIPLWGSLCLHVKQSHWVWLYTWVKYIYDSPLITFDI